jgi:hypothetical protein
MTMTNAVLPITAFLNHEFVIAFGQFLVMFEKSKSKVVR